MSAPKEPFYDEKISPLMSQIIALCKEAKINMAAQFSLGRDAAADSTLFCTTVIDIDDDDASGIDRVRKLRAAMTSRPDFFAFTIIGKDPKP